MSDAVYIEFDRTNPVYHAGEVVSGTVVVGDGVGRKSRRVVLRTWWATQGRGGRVRGGKQAAVLYEGAQAADSAHRYPFNFVAPDWPFTYRGEHLSIDHTLQAVVEVPLAPDAKTEATFILVPGPVAPAVPDDLLVAPPEPPGGKSGRKSVAVGSLFLVLGIATFPLPGLFLLAVGAIVLGMGLRNELAASRAGKITVAVEPGVVSPGDQVRVTVGIFPDQPLRIRGVTAAFRAQEIVISGAGTTRNTHRHVAHLDEKTVLGAETLPGELKRETVGSFVVPDLGMWSFRVDRNEIRWEVLVRVRIPAWPDWSTSVPVVVWPARTLPNPERPMVAAGASRASSKAAPPRVTPPEAALPRVSPAESTPGTGRATKAKPAPSRPDASPATPPRPAASHPAASHPATSQPATSQPATSRPAASRPAASRPAASRPAASRPAASRPAASRPATSQPATSQPAASHPAASHHGASHPAASHPAASQHGASQPAVGRPGFVLATAVREILATRSHTPERTARVAALIGRQVEADMVVERSERPFGRTRTPGYENGRVLKGKLRGTGLEVEARIPTSKAHLAENLGPGDEVRLSGEVMSWARLPERPVIQVPKDG